MVAIITSARARPRAACGMHPGASSLEVRVIHASAWGKHARAQFHVRVYARARAPSQTRRP